MTKTCNSNAQESNNTCKNNINKSEYSVFHAGKFDELGQYQIKHPLVENPIPGKLFLKDKLGLTGMQVSFGIMPAGAAVSFYHQHKQNEELYIFTSGKGQIQLNGEIIDVSEGTAVRVAPQVERTWRNNSSEPLHYIVIQAKENSLTQDTIDDGIPGARPVSW